MDDALRRRLSTFRVTPRAFALFSIISVAAPVITDFQATDTLLDVGLEVVLGALSTLTLAVFLWPALSVVDRWVEPGLSRFGVIVVVLAMGGAIRGLVLHYLGPEFSYLVDTTVFERAANSVSTTVVWLTVFSFFTAATDDFSSRYQALLKQALYQRASAVSASDIRVVLSDVEKDLRKLRLPTPSPETPVGDMEKIAVELRSDVMNTIRAHSRELWSLRGAAPPALRFWPLLRLAASKLTYSIGVLVAVFTALSLGNIASIVGPQEALVRVFGALAVIVVLDTVWRRWLSERFTHHLAVNIAYLLALGVGVMFPMGLFEFYGTGSPASYLVLLLLALPVAALPLIESTINLTQLARDELLELMAQLDSNQEGDGDEEDSPHSSSDLASYLHNSLQAEIQSIIYALERAVGDPDKVGLGQASLERLRMLSARSLDEDFDSFSRVPLEHLNALIASWRGILDITLDWQLPESASQDKRLPTVVNIIQEVSSNSVAHAAATTLEVSVFLEDDDILVRLHNNADYLPRTPAGQGTTWLDSFLVSSEKKPGSTLGTTLLFRV